MSKGQSLQDPFLNALRKDRIPVSIFLVNGIKLQGQIESFDQYVVLLKNTVSQMVYKHAISTIVPARNPRTAGDAPTTAGYQGTPAGTSYPMSGGTGFERSYDRTGFSSGTRQGGFTRTPPGTGFERQSGFERSGYQGGQGFERSGGFESRGFGGGFDRSSYEERGFDGKNFEPQSKSFEAKGFDGKAFSDDEDDYNA